MDPIVVRAGTQLALGLAGLYLPVGAGPAVSGLAALMSAITELNKRKGRDPGHIPSLEEIDEYIAFRESQRIPI